MRAISRLMSIENRPLWRISMLRSTSLRQIARLAVFLPFAFPFAGCSDDGGSATASDAGSSDGGSNDGAVANDGGSADAVVPDTTPPKVVSTNPLDMATGVATAGQISASFDEEMDPLTITNATFALKKGTVDVPGIVTYFNAVAVFSPATELALSTLYTATITTGAKDTNGNALVAAYTWSFTTDSVAAVGPAPVPLGASGKYVILAKSAISNVPTSAVTGNLGLSPAAASYITGFTLTRAGTKWTAPEVTGGIFAANNDPPTPSDLTTAVTNMQTAYTDAAGRPNATMNLGAGTLTGLTLTPGLYKWTSSVTIPTDLMLAGAPNDTWIFQVTGDLKLASAKRMILSGGARAKNIVWQVAGFVELGTTSHSEGVMLSKTAITLQTGASINGRLMAQTAVSIAGATVTAPAP